jgi:signal transduction histidine kinase
VAEASSTFDLVARLSERANRAATAQTLTPLLGVETLLLFVKDPALAVLVPAPGFPQTLRGGPAWQAFLSRCAVAGRHSGTVDLPAGDLRPAVALVSDGAAAVAIGGKPVESELATLERLLPMLSVTLAAEQQVFIAVAEAADARSAAGQARALAQALEAARADASRLNAELRQEHRRKDDFLAMLAHELRNPLAPLVASVDVLRQCGNDASIASGCSWKTC